MMKLISEKITHRKTTDSMRKIAPVVLGGKRRRLERRHWVKVWKQQQWVKTRWTAGKEHLLVIKSVANHRTEFEPEKAFRMSKFVKVWGLESWGEVESKKERKSSRNWRRWVWKMGGGGERSFMKIEWANLSGWRIFVEVQGEWFGGEIENDLKALKARLIFGFFNRCLQFLNRIQSSSGRLIQAFRLVNLGWNRFSTSRQVLVD